MCRVFLQVKNGGADTSKILIYESADALVTEPQAGLEHEGECAGGSAPSPPTPDFFSQRPRAKMRHRTVFKSHSKVNESR